MNRERLLWGIILTLVLLVVLFIASSRIADSFAPRPVASWVAVEVAESGVAQVGPVAIAAGTPFTLHAVLVAEDRQGESIYYTEAGRLTIGEEEIDPARVSPWEGSDTASILWFSVEGSAPYAAIGSVDDLEAFEFRELFRADWPRSWSIPGSLETTREELLGSAGWEGRTFGTQRYHVRIELFGPESRITPRFRLGSPGVTEMLRDAATVATVEATLDGDLEGISLSFGKSQMEVAPNAAAAAVSQVAAWADSGLVFSRAGLIRDLLERGGGSWEELGWSPADLRAGTDESVADVPPGSLIRVGARVVVLFRDLGELGRLDGADLCFDFHKGAEVRSLEDVFEGNGLVEWAPLR